MLGWRGRAGRLLADGGAGSGCLQVRKTWRTRAHRDRDRDRDRSRPNSIYPQQMDWKDNVTDVYPAAFDLCMFFERCMFLSGYDCLSVYALPFTCRSLASSPKPQPPTTDHRTPLRFFITFPLPAFFIFDKLRSHTLPDQRFSTLNYKRG